MSDQNERVRRDAELLLRERVFLKSDFKVVRWLNRFSCARVGWPLDILIFRLMHRVSDVESVPSLFLLSGKGVRQVAAREG